jgi:2-amino-4-hydroxy-6-hydroxymethyldihydropteridine diphosphokinase
VGVPLATGYLGLGSNVGDRRANLQAAVDALPRHGVGVVASSSTYDTDPVGEVRDQPSFLNACLRVETDLDPEALLELDFELAVPDGRRLADALAALPLDEGVRREGDPLKVP